MYFENSGVKKVDASDENRQVALLSPLAVYLHYQEQPAFVVSLFLRGHRTAVARDGHPEIQHDRTGLLLYHANVGFVGSNVVKRSGLQWDDDFQRLLVLYGKEESMGNMENKHDEKKNSHWLDNIV